MAGDATCTSRRLKSTPIVGQFLAVKICGLPGVSFRQYKNKTNTNTNTNTNSEVSKGDLSYLARQLNLQV